MYETLKRLRIDLETYKEKKKEVIAQLYAHGLDPKLIEELQTLNRCIKHVKREITGLVNIIAHDTGRVSH